MSVTTRPPGRPRTKPGPESRRPVVDRTTRSRAFDTPGPSYRPATETLDSPQRSDVVSRGVGTGRFVAIVIAALIAGPLLLLAINNSLASGAFQVSRLESQLVRLSEEREAVQSQVNTAASAGQLQSRASQMGMVPVTAPAFVDLNKGTIEGRLIPAGKAGAGQARQVGDAPASTAAELPPTPATAAAQPAVPPPVPPPSSEGTSQTSQVPEPEGIDGAAVVGGASQDPPGSVSDSGTVVPSTGPGAAEQGASVIEGSP